MLVLEIFQKLGNLVNNIIGVVIRDRGAVYALPLLLLLLRRRCPGFISWNPDGFTRFIKSERAFNKSEFFNYDFITILETWAETCEPIEKVFDGYDCFSVNAKRFSRHGRASGSIALYVKKQWCQGETAL